MPNVALSKSSEEDDLVHEKGGTERTLEFASRADIVATCCTLNPSTVSFYPQLCDTKLSDL